MISPFAWRALDQKTKITRKDKRGKLAGGPKSRRVILFTLISLPAHALIHRRWRMKIRKIETTPGETRLTTSYSCETCLHAFIRYDVSTRGRQPNTLLNRFKFSSFSVSFERNFHVNWILSGSIINTIQCAERYGS